jgi:uncharacterized protein DUF4279
MESERMYSEVYAEFNLFGLDMDPDQVTALVGISPSKTWRLGDPIGPPPLILRYKNNGWRLKSELPLSLDLEEHVKSVIDQLQPSWAAFVELGTRYSAEISCVVKSYGGDRPPISFNEAVVKRAAELNAAIDIDLYIFDDDP